MNHPANYEKRPAVTISGQDHECLAGWDEVLDALKGRVASGRETKVAIECYPGVLRAPLQEQLVDTLKPALLLAPEDAFLSSTMLEDKFSSSLTNDPVFGRMLPWEIEDFFDPDLLEATRQAARACSDGLVLAIGTGASLLFDQPHLLVYVDVARWEIQQRQRRKQVSNLGLDNCANSPAQLYKRAYFLDWRVADRLKNRIFSSVDYWIDGNLPNDPKMLTGELFERALQATVRQPFRLVPFFDPGPWGGQWMRERLGLPDGPPNYAWGFDCVPEENSLVLRFGKREFELPALTLVHRHPLELLGASVYARYGAEFPIRFDFLDTMAGGNLSLQVHPLAEYIGNTFHMPYTQDESYYMLDAGPKATVYLGLKDGIDRESMADQLHAAQSGGPPFAAEQFVNRWPAAKHDHFLIPAGTIHCSGSDAVVLEISATPYIFTFKLWDWGRLGLDGRPRPIHLDHGLKNIQWDRTTDWVERELVNATTLIASGDQWREEKTGLHPLEFIETRRHWFTGQVAHDTQGNLNVLNLVEGDAVVVESPTGAFAPLTIHYAETFIVPAVVGSYTVRPAQETASEPIRESATIKAYVRG